MSSPFGPEPSRTLSIYEQMLELAEVNQRDPDDPANMCADCRATQRPCDCAEVF